MTEFTGVAQPLEQALRDRGYTHATPVQKAVLDPSLDGSDLLVSAQTGSGKTVAFGLALASSLLVDGSRLPPVKRPLALIVAPTRELAMQVRRELDWLYAPAGVRTASCIGGMDMRRERQTLAQGAHIVIGTPGRLRDHIDRRSLNTGDLRVVVLDEADEMLDLGFREDLEFILDAAPSERRTLMFSATVPRSIASLAKRYQRDAVRISTSEEKKQHVDIDYRALTVAPKDRENAVVNVLRYYDAKTALVFCATRATVNHMTSRFANRGFSVVALSGELSQNERTHALQAMRDGRARVCIATDVAARGIDLPNLELVVHADIPKTSDTLLHRSGRTGRAGRKGICAIIVPKNAGKKMQRMLDKANIKATWERPPSAEDIIRKDQDRVLDDPQLRDPITDDEAVFVSKLLDRYSPEAIAGAFLRQRMAGQSAPEELLDTAPESPSKERDDFKNGVWFHLTVGRNQKAEPRWLLPLLCRVGGMSKGDIGAIRIHDEETHVEIAPQCVEKFLEGLGSDLILEKGIKVSYLDAATVSVAEPRNEQHKPRKGKKSGKAGKRKFDPKARKRKSPKKDKKESGRQNRHRPD